MPKLPVVSGKIVMHFLEKEWFTCSRSRWSHRVYIKISDGDKIITVVPDHKELDIKTLKSILRQSRISEEFFIEKI